MVSKCLDSLSLELLSILKFIKEFRCTTQIIFRAMLIMLIHIGSLQSCGQDYNQASQTTYVVYVLTLYMSDEWCSLRLTPNQRSAMNRFLLIVSTHEILSMSGSTVLKFNYSDSFVPTTTWIYKYKLQ